MIKAFLWIQRRLRPEAVGNRKRIGVNRMRKVAHPGDQLRRAGMAMMVRDILPQPAPQRLNGHEVWAITRQRLQGDRQILRQVDDGAGAVIGCAIPHQDHLAGWFLLTQTVQDGEGVLGVGTREVPNLHLPRVVEIDPIETHFCGQPGGLRADPQPLPDRCPTIAQIRFLMDVRFVDRDHQRRLWP
jgi:hypothetical protein